jgi:hypothetical protein
VRALVLAAVALAAASGLDRHDFRWTRTLSGPAGGALSVRVDGPLFAHARPSLADLRVVDAHGDQVPWRLPSAEADPVAAARVLDVGRVGGSAVALLDLGPRRVVRDRIDLELPQRRFVGRATVSGSDTRGGPFVRLATTPVYDVAGPAGAARSTAVVFGPADFRYYRVAVTGVRAIAGASAASRPQVRVAQPLSAGVERRELGDRTRIVVDLRWARTPVDALRVTARSPRYDRAVRVDVADTPGAWHEAAVSRVVHFPGTTIASLPLATRGRYLRVTIFDGDDRPLAGVRVVALQRPRLLLVEGDRPRPYTVLYGSGDVPTPDYDFARLPAPAAQAARLGAERRNPLFEPRRVERRFFDRNRWLVQAALVVVALVVGAAGFVAIRKRA